MKLRNIFITLSLLLVMAQGYSQMSFHEIVAVSWEMSFPTDNDFLSKSSPAGGRIEYRHMLTPKFSAGVGFSWNSFSQYVNTKTYENAGGAAVTTDMVREIYTAPITLLGHYYPTVNSHLFKPYVGLGIGAQYAEQNVYFNVYQIGNNDWGFDLRPEIGTLVRFAPSFGALVTFSYNYATNKNKAFSQNSLQQFGINIGFAGVL